MRTFRTLLELKIKERRQTLVEFVEYAETFAREHGESGTLSLRHLQRLIAGHGAEGQPLGPLRPATARLLEGIFGSSVDELLAPPAQPTLASDSTADLRQRILISSRAGSTVASWSHGELTGIRNLDCQLLHTDTSPTQAGYLGADFTMLFDWLDEHAGWIPDTSRRKVTSRLAKMSTRELINRHSRRVKVSRSQVADFLLGYYVERAPGYGTYRARCGEREVLTSIVTQPCWLDLTCPLGEGNDRLVLINTDPDGPITYNDICARHAVYRLAEAAALDIRVTNKPIYRLLDIDVRRSKITGSVGLVPFVEYALTMDLLENEAVDAIVVKAETRCGSLPLRDRYLPDLASVLNFSGRLCAGGVLALCAIARPFDPYRGAPDYALLIQQRSSHVLNAAGRLAVIPKCFHQPLADVRSDVQIGVTLRREMEQELFGRSEVDSTVGECCVAAPMHPGRLSEPMRWLAEEVSRLRMECTGFGLNLVSGNYEFTSLTIIEDEEFWSRYGGQIEANWESAGLRLYSSLDDQLITELIVDESWSNEGLFALLQGLRRLRELGGDRVNLPVVEWSLANYS